MKKVKIAVLGTVGLLAATTIMGAGANARGIASLDGIARSHGIPTSADELKALSRVPYDDNAYALYPAFRDSYKAEAAAASKLKVTLPPLGTSMAVGAEPFDPAKAKAYLGLVPLSLTAAEAMASRSKWFVDRDMSNPAATLYPEFSDLKSATKLLVLDAQLKLSSGDREGALEQYAKAAKIGTFSNSEPVLIGTLVYIACQAIVVTSIAHEAPNIAGDPAAEQKAIAILDSIRKPDLALAMKGEGFFNYHLLKNGLPLELFQIESGGDDSENENATGKPRVALMNATRGLWGPELLTHEGQTVESAQGNDYTRFEAQTARTEKWLETPGAAQAVGDILVPVFSQASFACQRLLIERDLVRVGLSAIAAKRQPTVDGTVDPFSGKPYKVVPQANGWKVYSIGKDRIDGGGEIDRKEPAQSKDIIFTYDGQAHVLGN